MLERNERVYVIALHGQNVRVKALRFKWGDLVLTEDVDTKPVGKRKKGERLPAGSILRRNRQLGKDSKDKKNKSEWMLYGNLYDLARAGEHIDTRYNTVEFDQLEALKSKARQYVQYLVYVKRVRPEDREAAYAAYANAIDELSTKRATRKVVAGARFSEAVSASGMEEYKDSLGRPNRPAAAMKVGAGIGHLIERWEDVGGIAARTDLRTIEVHAAINQHLMTYWDAWVALHPDAGVPYRSSEAVALLYLPIPEDVVGPVRIGKLISDPNSNLGDLSVQLQQWRDKFDAIQERPFRNNAAHMTEDARAAVEACEDGDLQALDEAVEQMRNAIRWMFALHVLQNSVITPLSMLLDRLERVHGTFKSKEKDGALIVERSWAKDDFALLENAMKTFETRVLRCHDKGFKRQLKNAVLAQVAMLQALMKCNNWVAVKERALLLTQKF